MKENTVAIVFFGTIFLGLVGLYFYTEVIKTENDIFISNKNTKKTEQETTSEVKEKTPVILSSDPAIGSTSAPITIIEYGEFQCEACKEAHIVIKEIIRQKENDVRWVWKDIINTAHTNSLSAATAARCAQQQGKFWEFSELLFANQARISTDLYTQIAKNLNINNEAFTLCLNDKNTKNTIASNSLLSQESLNITETPVLYINSIKYSGVISVPALLNAIKNATTEKK